MIIREKVRIGDQTVTLETGRIAKQAGGSVLVRAGDTIVLVTVCGNQEPKPGQGFFPLSVDYQEKTYAAGKIPGGFFKREGKLRDYEVLTSRLIDRPCRPLFPEGYLAEVQIVATVMSFDQVNPPDVLAMVGASAALHISPIPWSGPIAGVRVARVDGEFIANPTYEQMAQSDCELLVAASRDAIVMVEGEADEISEEDMVEALLFAHRSVQDTLDLIERMKQAVGKPKWSFAGDTTPAILRDRLRAVAGFKVREACSIAHKGQRADAFKQIRREAVEVLSPEFPGQDEAVKSAFEDLRYTTMRAQVLDEGRRLDGRDTRTVRPISIELGVLPRVHGSSLFTRGETQAIVTGTLGTARDSQRLDTLQGDVHKRFLLHYNFPPYSVGECKPMRGPGRREVGHGDLAERALLKVLPSQEEFPYTIRIVSEITESNGSSSMASVCGGALALMDAGVPIKAPVAGVAMGLIKEGDHYAVLTDILGDEDALGDMDFKVCGTEKGVTAIQMDIKIEGLSREILERALEQAREARLHILDKMQRAISAPREELSQYAPRITQIRVKPDQVRTIIGPGGKMIRAIVDQTGASIDVEDDGTVNVASADSASVAKALEIIKSLTTDPEIGEIYEGVVKRIEPYGAFLEIMPGKDGLCHISDVDWTHVTNVEDYFKLGDKVPVKLTNIDREGRIRLSRKDALPEPSGGAVSKLNGRAPEGREERPFGRDVETREERPARRDFDAERAARGRDEARPQRVARVRDAEPELDRPARDLDRPARDLDRPAARARDFDRDERPARGGRDEARPRTARRDAELDRPARNFDEGAPAKAPRTLDREERPAARAARILGEDRPAKRDFDRDERPAKRDFDRDERPAAKLRDFDRDERPAKRDFDRDERPAAKLRDFDRDERPAKRDFDRDERPAKLRDFDRDERPAKRDFDRDERPAARSRDLDRDERPAKRDFDRDERPARLRDFDRDERPAKPARELSRDAAKPRDFDRPARGRGRELGEEDARRERTPTLIADERDDRPRTRETARDETRETGTRTRRGELREAKPRDLPPLEDERPRGRELGGRSARRELDERPLRPVRDPEARQARDVDAPAKPARRDLDAPPARTRRDASERPAAARDEGFESPRGRREPEERGRLRGGREASEEREPRVGRDRRDAEPEERPVRLRGPREERDDERFEQPVRNGHDAERPVRTRGAETAGRAEAPTRAKRGERPAADEPAEEARFSGRRAPAVAAEREERTERDRVSRVRARARNRERVRELEREREGD